jgi:hypothetical protein
MRYLTAILPLTDAAVDEVPAATRPGIGRQWNAVFRPLQVGKAQLYRWLTEQGLHGLMVHQYPGIVTQQLCDHRAHSALTTSHQQDAQTFTSHAVDAWMLAAATSGATTPPCARLWYVVPAILHRRQLTRQEASKGGMFKSYGGTLSLGFKRVFVR